MNHSNARPLVALVTMVKNEARSMDALVASALAEIDAYVVLDTGSTDGTQAIARARLGELPGRLAEEPFVDFATSRNRSIDLAAELGARFALLLSGDETLACEPGALRAFCEAQDALGDAAPGAFNVRLQYHGLAFDSPRLVRPAAGWRYHGVVHEVLCNGNQPPPSIRVPGAEIVHVTTDHGRKHLRKYKDLELLNEQIRRAPDETRTQFYLAQTLDELGLHEQARAAYARRVAMGGWAEEAYEAAYRQAQCAARCGAPWSEVQQLYLDAHALQPARAEPLFAIAQHWYGLAQHHLCWLFAARAAALPYPEHATLFVQPSVYAWLAADLAAISGFYCGEPVEGERLARKALAANPHDPRLRENVRQYEVRRGVGATPAPTPPVVTTLDDAPPVALPPRAAAIAADGGVVVVTTLAPDRLDVQRAAVASWIAAGCAVVAFNDAAEAATLAPAFADLALEFATPTRVARPDKPVPFVRDAVAMLAAGGVRVGGLVNSDIVLRGAPCLGDRLYAAARDALLYAQRVNVDALDAAEGVVEHWGADAFFFEPAALLAVLDPLPFAFGLPWWDLWLPLAAEFAGLPTRRVAALAYHVKHPQRWSGADRETLRTSFAAFIAQRLPAARVADFAAERATDASGVWSAYRVFHGTPVVTLG